LPREPRGQSSRAVHDLLDAAASRTPEAPAVQDCAVTWTYRELAGHSRRLASWLVSRGVTAGDRVLLRCPNSAQAVALAYAVSRAGAVLVPVSPQMPDFQLGSVTADAGPVVAIIVGGYGDAVAATAPVVSLEDAWAEAAAGRDEATPGRRPAPDDLAILFYTSGTTATPKGVMCPHRQVLFAAEAIARRLGYTGHDAVFCRPPFSFDYGLYQAFLAALGGSRLLLPPGGSDPALLRLIREWDATVVPLVPATATMLTALAARDPRPTRVRLFTNTGAALAPGTAARLRRFFPGARVCLMFGITECKRVSILEPDGDLLRPGSVGTPLDGTRVTVVDPVGRALPPGEVGEFAVSGPHVSDGYWRAPELTATRFRADPVTGCRTLYTGDFGHMDADGHLYFQGRRDEIFKHHGVRTSTVEIEAAAVDIPGVQQAAVRLPDEHGSLALIAVASIPASQLMRELRRRLGPDKVPPACHVVPRLPLTPNGKVDRTRLAGLPAASQPERLPPRATRRAPQPSSAELARAYGTPQYVYQLDRFRSAAATLRAALPDRSRLYYSVKANPHPRLIGELAGLGLHAEISSPGELAAVQEAKYPPGDCLYTGPGKTDEELAGAVARGVRLFSAESVGDGERLAVAAQRHGAQVDFLVRVNASAGAAGSGLRMTGRASQFGVDAETITADHPIFAGTPAARPVGVHLFSATNVPGEQALAAELELSIATAAEVLGAVGLVPRLVDIGGGFAAPFAQPGPVPTYLALRTALERSLDAHLPGWRADAPGIAFESGRRLAAGCGTLLTRVVDVKRSRGVVFAVLDAGINVLGGMGGLGRLLTTSAQPDQAPGTAEPVTLAGPLCTPLDILGRQVALSAVEPGTLLEIPNVGAYGLTAGLIGFLSRPAAAEVVLDDGQVVDARRLELHAVDLAGRPTEERKGRDG
jgi:amino acid adenylation domain-containing protein